MQHSPYEIKDKLLKALDKHYNVVDMAVVTEVISILERITITKDVLEKTRLGKYVNELRKKTTNEQLAKRAKDLVKIWRRLLPQPDSNALNGERIISGTSTPPINLTGGPGPGPGFGPGPGPGNRSKTCISTPAISRYKSTSPAVTSEHVTSPLCSSASNSPLLPLSRCQGPNRPTTPSTYAPVATKASHTNQVTPLRTTSRGNQALPNASNLTKVSGSNQVFKPVSPALSTAKHNANSKQIATGSALGPMVQPQSPAINPAFRNNSRSQSPCVNALERTLPAKNSEENVPTRHSSQSSTPSPPPSLRGVHSTLDLARTNAANKRLRKEDKKDSQLIPAKKINLMSLKKSLHNSTVVNGLDLTCVTSDGIMPSEGSAFESFRAHKKTAITNKHQPNDTICSISEKKNMVKAESVREKSSNVPSGSKLQKVKTTQQLIAEFQAKKSNNISVGSGLATSVNLSYDNVKNENNLHLIAKGSSSHPLQSSDADLTKTKSELMYRFLQSSGSGAEDDVMCSSPINISIRPSSAAESFSQRGFDHLNSDVVQKTTSGHIADPVTEEIKRILSTLPKISHDEIDLEDNECLPVRTEPVTEESVNRILNEQWDNVNGNYSLDGTWNKLHEVNEKESYGGDVLRILPYVNIDW